MISIKIPKIEITYIGKIRGDNMGRRMERRRERKKKRRNNIKKILRTGILFLIFGVIAFAGIEFYQESQIQAKEYTVQKVEAIQQEKPILEQQIDQQEQERQAKKKDVHVLKEYHGFEVDSYLEIPAFNFKTEVLKNYTKEGMEVCVSKYWGPNPNEIGNYCIAGHNYITERMFSKLKNLKIGDTIFLSDNTNGKYTYVIYDIYKVTPENVTPLGQETQGKREITLITCNNYSKSRLVVKAVEQE